VHRQIHVAGQQRSLDFLCEHAARTNLFDGHDLFDVTACRNLDQLNGMSEPTQRARHPFRLPASKLAATCP
jgi:hypothetical protein